MELLFKILTSLFGEGLKVFFDKRKEAEQAALVTKGAIDATTLQAVKKADENALAALAVREAPKSQAKIISGLRKPSQRAANSVALLALLPLLGACGMFQPIIQVDAKTGGCEWVRGLYFSDPTIAAVEAAMNQDDKAAGAAVEKDMKGVADHNELYERFCPSQAKAQDGVDPSK